VVAWGLYLFLIGPGSGGDAPVLKGTGLSEPAAYDWTLERLDGGRVSFGEYRGKPVVLNVWATWCGPCVRELPSIARLARSPRLPQVAFVCVSVDENPDTVRGFLQGKDWPMTVLHATDLPPVFRTDGIPATFVIAPDGRIAASVIGSAAWDDPSVVEFLGHLAGESRPAPVTPAP
jgi:thiol-disulfide isomerase/thioredoxin